MDAAQCGVMQEGEALMQVGVERFWDCAACMQLGLVIFEGLMAFRLPLIVMVLE